MKDGNLPSDCDCAWLLDCECQPCVDRRRAEELAVVQVCYGNDHRVAPRTGETESNLCRQCTLEGVMRAEDLKEK